MDQYTVKKFYDEVLVKSWTYARMTETEKRLLALTFDRITSKATTRRGSSIAANKVYRRFLECIGYNGYNWRETEKAPF